MQEILAEKSNHIQAIRLTHSERQRIRMLAKESGYATISEYVRSRCLTPIVEIKLNEILKEVKSLKEGENE